MKKLIPLSLLLAFVSSAMAQQKVLRVYDWKDLISQYPPAHCKMVSMDGMSVLKIENTNNAPLEVSLLTITNSSLAQKIASISCEMKYDLYGTFPGFAEGQEQYSHLGGTGLPESGEVGDITRNGLGQGGLELSYHAPTDVPGGDENTNASMYLVNGSSNWRRCNLGVQIIPHLLPPTGLQLKIYFPGKGTVYLRPVKVMGIIHSWWSPEQIGYIGGTGGSLIGCLGALIGILAGLGKARRFVLATTKILIALGILATMAGIVALIEKQPYAVWYPLVLTGGILTFVLAVNLYPIKRRYDDQEIRRMTSMDATGG